MQEFSNYVNENGAFALKQDNPLIYTMVIAKLAKHNNDKNVVKADKTLFDAVNRVEKICERIDTKKLRKEFSPVALYGIFDSKTSKNNLKEYVEQYYKQFEDIITENELTFDGAWEVHNLFKEFTESDEFVAFLKSL